jgi:hypothetical protein
MRARTRTRARTRSRKPFVSRAVSGDHAPRHRGVAPQSGSSVSLVVVSSEALLLNVVAQQRGGERV